MAELLRMNGLNAGYEQMQILWDVGLSVNENECALILGSNGAGKTTLLKALVGLLPPSAGEIVFAGAAIHSAAIDQRIRQGIAYLSEVGVIPSLTIEDNLRLGGYFTTKRDLDDRMEAMYRRLPVLKEKRKALGGSLSGGQRKMLAVAKALMSHPKLLVMDEPSAGLSPRLVSEIMGIFQDFRGTGLSMLIAEQNVKFLDIADKVYVLDSGRITFSGTVAELRQDDAIRKAYFGVS